MRITRTTSGTPRPARWSFNHDLPVPCGLSCRSLAIERRLVLTCYVAGAYVDCCASAGTLRQPILGWPPCSACTYSVRPKFKIRAFLQTKIWIPRAEKQRGVGPSSFQNIFNNIAFRISSNHSPAVSARRDTIIAGVYVSKGLAAEVRARPLRK